MAKVRSDKSPYESKFGGGWISASQYIAEVMCEKKALYDKKPLPQLFWKQPVWCKEFLKQVRHATTLLESYDISAILAGIRRPEAKKVFSLGLLSVLAPLFQEEQERVQRVAASLEQAAAVVVESPVDVTKKPRAPIPKKSVVSKLRNL